jgi:hypothetical protein
MLPTGFFHLLFVLGLCLGAIHALTDVLKDVHDQRL